MHILIVDDEKLVRWYFERSLKKCGHTVVSAENVKQAIQILQQDRFDAVFVDMKLPDGMGIAVINELLSYTERPEKVIACSAYLTASIEHELSAKGVMILNKPFKIEELRALIGCGNLNDAGQS